MATPGVSQFNINPTALRKHFLIPLPPLDEQRAICDILDAWDRGIRQLADLIAAKVRFKQGLMQQLLTGKRRFNGFNDEWHSVHLKDVAEECEERNRGRLGTESVMAVTKADGIVPMRERTIAADINRYSVVQKDCFAYNPMRLRHRLHRTLDRRRRHSRQPGLCRLSLQRSDRCRFPGTSIAGPAFGSATSRPRETEAFASEFTSPTWLP